MWSQTRYVILDMAEIWMTTANVPRYKAYCDSLQKLTLSSWHVWSHQSRSAGKKKKRKRNMKRWFGHTTDMTRGWLWTSREMQFALRPFQFHFPTSFRSNPGMFALHQWNIISVPVRRRWRRSSDWKWKKPTKLRQSPGWTCTRRRIDMALIFLTFCHYLFGLNSERKTIHNGYSFLLVFACSTHCFSCIFFLYALHAPCRAVIQVLWDNTSLLLTAWKDITKDELLSRTAWKCLKGERSLYCVRIRCWSGSEVFSVSLIAMTCPGKLRRTCVITRMSWTTWRRSGFWFEFRNALSSGSTGIAKRRCLRYQVLGFACTC